MTIVEKIRVSTGSASVLGLNSTHLEVAPTNCYLMTYKLGHCAANCGFCPQARESKSSIEKLSRVSWPIFPFKEFLTKLKYTSPLKRFQRICIQTLNYPENFKDLIEIVSQIKKVSSIPISVAIPPLEIDNLKELKFLGVERVGIALDGATQEIFEKVKGKDINGIYTWEGHLNALGEALDIFKEGLVSTHLIVGLGESEKEILERIEDLINLKILVSLFAFTPVKGTKLEGLNQPDLISFRRIQLARHLILKKNKTIKDFTFNLKENIINININKLELENIVFDSDAFLTSGCPGCNRPYYTSRPSGPTYNYPRKLTKNEKDEIYDQLKRFVK